MRASYSRTKRRVESIWDPNDPGMRDYDAKFDALTYYWPGVGQARSAADSINDFNRYLSDRGMTWSDVKDRGKAAKSLNLGGGFTYVSKNLLKGFYRGSVLLAKRP